MSRDELLREARRCMLGAARRMAGRFPLHAEALRGEALDQSPSGERWSRMNAVICSLKTIPGIWMSDDEKAERLTLLEFVSVPMRARELLLDVSPDDRDCRRRLESAMEDVRARGIEPRDD